MNCEDVSSNTMDECLPLHYRKFYEDLPEQQQLLTPTNQSNNRKVKDIFVSPTGTVSTMASSVVSAPVAGGEVLSPQGGTATLIGAPPVPFPLEITALRAARRASLRAKMLRRGSSDLETIPQQSASTATVVNEEATLIVNLQHELDETKEALRKLEARMDGKENKKDHECGNFHDDDQISTTSTEAVSGGEILQNDPWNDSIRSFVSGTSEPLEYLSVPDEVSVVSRKLDLPSDEERSLRIELMKSERHAKLLEAKLRASEAVASTLFKSLTDIRKKQSEMDRLNKNRASTEDIELMLHHSLLLRGAALLALIFLASGYVELFAAIVIVLFFSLEVVAEEPASS